MKPFFLDTGAGRCFAIHHPAASGKVHAQVLYLHPFAEEMNKSRRMVALQARALAANGVAVLQIDLHGCGDSPGELAQASWDLWLAQAQGAADWLIAQGNGQPLWLWGLRTGALLASDVVRQRPHTGLLLWQPVTSGKQALRQFLRLRLAGELPAGNGAAMMGAMKQQLQDGHCLEIGGYKLPPAVAHGLEQAELKAPAGDAPVWWLEVSSATPPALLTSSQATVAQWRARGCDVHFLAVPGPAFWHTTEIEEAPALIDATVAATLPGAQQPAA